MPGAGNPDNSLTPFAVAGTAERLGPKVVGAQIESLRHIISMGKDAVDYAQNYSGVDYIATECANAIAVLSGYVKDPTACLLKANAFAQEPTTYDEAKVSLEALVGNVRTATREELRAMLDALTNEVVVEFMSWHEKYQHLFGKQYGAVVSITATKPSDELNIDLWQEVGSLDEGPNSLCLSFRIRRVLRDHGVRYLGQLIQLTEAELLRMPDLGRISVKEIKDTLFSLGLSLAMQTGPYKSIVEKFNQDFAERQA